MQSNERQPFVYANMRLAFILLITCFAAWGVAANMTDPLVKVFSKIFTMSNFQSALVQFAYYGAYFCLALPAAFINVRFSYKTGVLTGLGLAFLGALAFYPASVSMTYGFFLAALFIMAAGMSILETISGTYPWRSTNPNFILRSYDCFFEHRPIEIKLLFFLYIACLISQCLKNQSLS